MRQLPDLSRQLTAHTCNVALTQQLSSLVAEVLAEPTMPRSARLVRPRYELFLPSSVASDFPRCSCDTIRQLSICAAYGLIYSGLIDTLIDQPASDHPNTRQVETAFRLFRDNLSLLFRPTSPFWGYLDGVLNRFFRAMAVEQQCYRTAGPTNDYIAFCQLAQDKMALALTAPIALALLDETPARISLLCQAWNEINIAVILSDDIQDWVTDYEEGHHTFLLNQVLLAHDATGPASPSIEEVAAWVIHSGILETLYVCGAAHLRQAVSLAHEAYAPALAELAAQRSQDFLRRRDRFVNRKEIAWRRVMPVPQEFKTSFLCTWEENSHDITD